jgi:methionyl aminopeptidase
MLSIVKNKTELKKLKAACKLAAETLKYAGSLVKAGISTEEIDAKVHKFITDRGAYPSPLNYDPTGNNPFPKSICTSVNDMLCHGIPDEYILKSGDIINIDVTVYLDGYHGDTSSMFVVGDISRDVRFLIESAKLARDETISIIRPGISTTNIELVSP